VGLRLLSDDLVPKKETGMIMNASQREQVKRLLTSGLEFNFLTAGEGSRDTVYEWTRGDGQMLVVRAFWRSDGEGGWLDAPDVSLERFEFSRETSPTLSRLIDIGRDGA
jgi:hypothetical protein